MKDLSSKDAADLVGQIPEIKEWLVTRSVSSHEFQVGPSTLSSDKLVTLSLNDVSFRTLLNPHSTVWNRGLGGGSLW
jgi:hypothetical protein